MTSGTSPYRAEVFVTNHARTPGPAWGIINLTLTIFSWVELVGHLPIYGIMAILLVWSPSDKTHRLWQHGVLGRGV